MSNFNWLSGKMFSRRIISRGVGMRFLSEGVKKKSEVHQGMINWNHPKLRTFHHQYYQKYAERDFGDRFWFRLGFGVFTGTLIGGVIGIDDDFDESNPIAETILGAMTGGLSGGLALAFYPIGIPLMGIIGVKKLIR